MNVSLDVKPEVIRWNIPVSMPNREGLSKSVNKFIEAETIRWENIPPTPHKHNIIESIDFSSVDRISPSFVSAVDETNYYWMSQTEVTDLLYRTSVYFGESIVRGTQNGLDIIRMVIN